MPTKPVPTAEALDGMPTDTKIFVSGKNSVLVWHKLDTGYWTSHGGYPQNAADARASMLRVLYRKLTVDIDYPLG